MTTVAKLKTPSKQEQLGSLKEDLASAEYDLMIIQQEAQTLREKLLLMNQQRIEYLRALADNDSAIRDAKSKYEATLERQNAAERDFNRAKGSMMALGAV